jgi:SAM-dependent methyltransferase
MQISERTPLDISTFTLHGDAELLSERPIRVVTPPQMWAYALSFGPEAVGLAPGSGADALAVVVDLEVIRGRIAVGVVNSAGDAYLHERVAGLSRRCLVVRPPAKVAAGRLVFRNAGNAGEACEFVLHGVYSVPREEAYDPYLVDLQPRSVASEERPPEGGTIVFDDAAAHQINRARMDWIDGLGLTLVDKNVLDVGCGVGHFSRFYLERGAEVVAVDGRQENVDVVRVRCPEIKTHVADVQRTDLRQLGTFDVVHCFGLLYHLHSPVAALQNLHAVCRDVLLLETMVCDSSRPVLLLADETKAVSQALDGLGSRPSPSFIVLALNRVGFPYVYGTTKPPAHPDFQFRFRDDQSTARDGHNLRCVFVASRAPVAGPRLVPLLEP